ncbi:hypothetical protein C882_3499 [Caenispirillum salinarum AK4]|uniref:EF-hand domain-containing protein n=1 Tax=Caenispirillum salinarum AK4 TaxID=1238182 RepID=K9HN56_9PROT|nr:hypothetical protein [Caenispirillum salinarum]EKV31748.1 hypothetical protein C882_3499 [Caenispirillum salinarum AK4]
MRTAIAAAALSALFAAPALAQSADPDAPDVMEGARAPAATLPMDETCLINSEFDLEDIFLGPQDFVDVMGALFMAWDENGDETLTPLEYNACTGKLDMPATFVAFDHDASGAITREEWVSRENFNAMDLNNDDRLSKGEFLFDDALTGEGLDEPE